MLKIQLKDANLNAYKVGKSVKHPKGEKLHSTKVEENTEQFLWEVFTPMDSDDCKDLRNKLIVLDTPFTTSPHLNKVMAAEAQRV